jgi:ataxin-3
MESIFHEKQEGQLCAQHALNALLQGSYFTAVDLAEIAKRLDEQERLSMAEGGTDSTEYRVFAEAKSHNMDDSGFFSIQVMSSALKVWQLEMISFNRKECPVAKAAREDPT